MRRATNTAVSGRPSTQREARGQRAIGRVRSELIHPQQEGARTVRIVPRHQHRRGAHHLAVGECQRLIARVARVAQRVDAARQRGSIIAQRQCRKLAVERRRPCGGALRNPARDPCPRLPRRDRASNTRGAWVIAALERRGQRGKCCAAAAGSFSRRSAMKPARNSASSICADAIAPWSEASA